MAFQDLRMAIRIEPDNAYAYKNMGTVYSYLNYPDSACYYYQKALRFDLLAEDKIEIKTMIEHSCK